MENQNKGVGAKKEGTFGNALSFVAAAGKTPYGNNRNVMVSE